MKNNLILLILALFAGIEGNCQKNLQPAYVVDNKNDTTNGFIDYREWYKNPESILFTQSKQAALQKFTINDVSSFSITGKEQYRRYKVNISMSNNTIGNMEVGDTASQNGIVWLKILHAGKNVQLFSYIDNIKTRLYILSSDEAVPVELKNTEYLSADKLISKKEYQNILRANAKKYAPGNVELQAKILALGFYKDDILNICYTINGIDEDDIKVEAAREKQNRIRFWAGIALNKGEIKVAGSNRYAGKTSGSTLSPLVAAGLNILVNPYIGKMFLSTEVSYATYKASAYTFNKYFVSKDNYYLEIKQANIALLEMLNYNLYNGRNFKYFIGAGAAFNFSAYPSNQETIIKEATSGTTTIINNNYIDPIRKFWVNVAIKTGVSAKNIELSISYLPNNNISNYDFFAVLNSSLRLQLNYVFKK